MLKYLRGKRTKPTLKSKLPKEAFVLKQTITHGFPHSPSCMAYDDKLSLLAIGTQKGDLRIYGRPGVKLEFSLGEESEIQQIKFVEGRGQLIVLSSDALYLLEINVQSENGFERSFVEKVKTCHHFHKEQREGNLKQITTMTINSTNEMLLVGTQGGNIYIISLPTFELTDEIIYQDVIIQNIPEDSVKKNNPGEVEVIAEKPRDADKFLIAYNRGLIVLWNNKTLSIENFYMSNQHLESVCWLGSGDQFISSHADGICIRWKIDDNLKPSQPEEKEYGPYACKPIHKIIGLTTIDRQEYHIFSGGLPRYEHSDKYPITIIIKRGAEKKHQVLDFPSAVIDFIVINSDDKTGKIFDYPEALLVLTSQEIVAIDLKSPDLLQYQLPYLNTVHSSEITSCQYFSNVPDDSFVKLKSIGAKQNENKYTSREWPIKGGTVAKAFTASTDVLVTGHDNGTIHFWAAGDISLQHLCSLETAKLFKESEDDIIPIDSDEVPVNETNRVEEKWPPFRSVGTYDPFVDDIRLKIQKIIFSPYSSTLVVGSGCGQVIVFSLTDDSNFTPLSIDTMNIIRPEDNFSWKGEPAPKPRSESVKFTGFAALALVQVNPPSCITALAWHPEWNLLAIGTEFGFGLYDFLQHNVVVCKSTANNKDTAALAEDNAPISRTKSFRKSVRYSFRNLKRIRSLRELKKPVSGQASSSSPSNSPTKSSDDKPQSTEVKTFGVKPNERLIEARPKDEITGAVTNCLYIGLAGIDKKDSVQAPTLWVGTRAGVVYAFAFKIPGLTPKEGEEDLRKTEKITFSYGREIRLAHAAPVIFIHPIDSTGYPLPDPLEVKHGKARAPSAADKILVCTEEQFILFTLPQLKHFSKYKLTAGEGVKARHVSISSFTSTIDESTEQCIACFTNSREVEVFTTDLEQKMKASLVDSQYKPSISFLRFTSQAEALYLHLFCEFKRFSLSPKRVVEAVCHIPLPEAVRPQRVVEVKEVSGDKPADEPKPEESGKEEQSDAVADVSTEKKQETESLPLETSEIVKEDKLDEEKGKEEKERERKEKEEREERERKEKEKEKESLKKEKEEKEKKEKEEKEKKEKKEREENEKKEKKEKEEKEKKEKEKKEREEKEKKEKEEKEEQERKMRENEEKEKKEKVKQENEKKEVKEIKDDEKEEVKEGEEDKEIKENQNQNQKKKRDRRKKNRNDGRQEKKKSVN